MQGIRVAGGVEVDAEGAFVERDAVLFQQADGLAGDGGGRVDDLDPGAGDGLDDRPQPRTMRSAPASSRGCREAFTVA